jgi:hypothetical protein
VKRAALALVAVAVAFGGGVARAQPRSYRPGTFQAGRVEAQAPTIELFSFDRGAVIFEKFGHSAICLKYHDPSREEVCFNYGITDFAGPPMPMIWNFLRGHQKFWVEPTPVSEIIRFYQWEDRTIWKQTLPLTDEQAREIEDKVWFDTREENKYYYYDHFFDNCTTRLRDMIDHATGGRLAKGADVDYPLTFREIGRAGMAEFPPIIGVSDFLVGRTLDRKPTLWEAMFLPNILRDQVKEKLGAEPELVYKRRGPDFPTDGPTDRGWVLLIAFLFYLPLGLAVWRGRFVRPALVWATIPLVLMGTIIWGVAIISSIPGLRWNEAAFLFMPFDLALPILRGDSRRKYAQIRAGMVVWASIFCAIGIFRQPLWIPILCAFVPHALVAWIEPMLAATRARPKDAEAAAAPASAVAKAS